MAMSEQESEKTEEYYERILLEHVLMGQEEYNEKKYTLFQALFTEVVEWWGFAEAHKKREAMRYTLEIAGAYQRIGIPEGNQPDDPITT